MKRIMCLFAAVLFFSLSCAFGQARVDVITSKNGDVLKGEIVENVPNNYVKIELPGGSMLTVKYSDIEKFSREKPSQQQPTNLPDQTNAAYNSENRSGRSGATQQGALGFGPKFELNFANVGGDGTSEAKSATLIGFGGFVTYNVAEQVALQGELLYNQKGFKIEGTMYSVNYTATQSFSYLELVTLVKYIIPTDGNVKPIVFAGPDLGILLSANEHVEAGTQSTDVDFKNNISGVDFGLIFGAGISIKLGSGVLLIDGRYNLGLANINKNSTVSNTNQVIGISIGYAFM